MNQVLINHKEIQIRLRELGEELARDYEGKNPVFLGVLNGSVIFLADLIREIPFSVEIDFIRAKSYSGTQSTGVVRIIKDTELDLTNRHVVLVEDIVDTGLTLRTLQEHIHLKRPASLEVATFLFKKIDMELRYKIKYVGFEIGNEFVVGYGLDFDGQYRNHPEILKLEP